MAVVAIGVSPTVNDDMPLRIVLTFNVLLSRRRGLDRLRLRSMMVDADVVANGSGGDGGEGECSSAPSAIPRVGETRS